MTGPADVVRRYYAVVADLVSSEEDLLSVLHPDVELVEHPNPIAPQGRRQDRAGMLAGFNAGKSLLREQRIDVHSLLEAGELVAVRSTWSGVVDRDAGPLVAGTRLTAHMAGFLTVRDGLVVRHETYDCYEPW